MSKVDRRVFLRTTAAAAGTASLAVAATQGTAGEQPDIGSLGKTPHTKFAVNIEMWWRGIPFLERIETAAEFGYPAVEFWPYQNKDLQAVAKLTAKRNLRIAQFTAWGFRPGMNHPKHEDRFIATIQEACQVAQRLDCGKMTVVAGDDQPGMTQAEMHEQVIKALRRAAPIAQRHKVMLILEPMNVRVDHKGHCLYGSEPAVRICRQVGSEFVKINWDLYHMQITEGDLCGRLREGRDQIGYLQLADHPGRNEPGTGEVHYNRVLREAQAIGYHGYVGLECRPKTTELAAAQGVARADVW